MKVGKPDVNFPELEREVLQEWQNNRTFEKSNEQRRGKKEFSFYDGPPFANGLPHYGHLLANTIKDIVPRYWNMRGYYVERRFGWDCHGLPVEYEIEKREDLKGRTDILAMGVGKFNELCRASVLHYTGEWQKTVTRLGRWVDWNNQYRTMDKSFMESVWWVFKALFDKGLVYRGYKVVPYSPRITAVLSNFEANQNYKETQDPAITAKFKLVDEDAYLLAWTTTPWTLVSNLALAVGPSIPYVKIRDHETGEVYYLAESRLGEVYKKKGKKKDEDVGYEVLASVSAKELEGRRYEPLFPYFRNHAASFRVLADDYVTTDEGTGIVHLAPAYGEDDYRVATAAGITLVDPLDEEGRYLDPISDYKGQFVKDADKHIIRDLKEGGKLLRHETIVHSYPFCERTDTPLIYRSIPAWYVAVEKIKDDLIANNQKINWVPEHLKNGRMGKWLENARDWAISRNRFWGTPIPIWICEKDDDHIECLGSASDLERLTGAKVDDMHKHFIDDLTFACPTCGGSMRRIAEVFDCWFESGSMPYAQLHYPFENKDRFDHVFPADFIAEGLDQTRGWFYTLSVLSTALFKSPAFKNVVVNGLVLAEDGRKMSKRWRNYTPPDELIEEYGADSVRLYMVNSAILRGEDLRFANAGVRDTTRAVLLPLWNAYSFLTTYAAADDWRPSLEAARGAVPKVKGELDRWIISRFHSLIGNVQEHMEAYTLYKVVPEVLGFIEDLTNWYIRLSRRRFWGGEAEMAQETKDAYATLYYVLLSFTKVFAPFAPFTADRIYKNLTDGFAEVPASVHLSDMPEPDRTLIDEALEGEMSLVRRVTELGRSLRAKHQIKTRQVLPSMLVITRHPEDKGYVEKGSALLQSELNLKQIEFSTDEARFVRLSVKPNLRTLGKRLGKELNTMRVHLEKLNESHGDVASLLATLDEQGKVTVLGHELTEEDFLIERGPKDDRLIATERGVTVLLDTTLTEELLREGLAREVVNRVQKLRKDSGLRVTDRIELVFQGDAKVQEAIREFNDYIAGETLAQAMTIAKGAGEVQASKHRETFDLDGIQLTVGLSVAP